MIKIWRRAHFEIFPKIIDFADFSFLQQYKSNIDLDSDISKIEFTDFNILAAIGSSKI
jgi:hypothetical protein